MRVAAVERSEFRHRNRNDRADQSQRRAGAGGIFRHGGHSCGRGVRRLHGAGRRRAAVENHERLKHQLPEPQRSYRQPALRGGVCVSHLPLRGHRNHSGTGAETEGGRRARQQHLRHSRPHQCRAAHAQNAPEHRQYHGGERGSALQGAECGRGEGELLQESRHPFSRRRQFKTSVHTDGAGGTVVQRTRRELPSLR